MNRIAQIVTDRKRRQPARLAVAVLAAIALMFAVHLGVAVGGGLRFAAADAVAAGDGLVARHPAVARDGIRPVFTTEHADRSAPPLPPIAALAEGAACAGDDLRRISTRRRGPDEVRVESGRDAFQARAPPVLPI